MHDASTLQLGTRVHGRPCAGPGTSGSGLKSCGLTRSTAPRRLHNRLATEAFAADWPPRRRLHDRLYIEAFTADLAVRKRRFHFELTSTHCRRIANRERQSFGAPPPPKKILPP